MTILTGIQETAVKSNAHRIVVLAGPGAGKTRTLTARVTHLVQNCKVQPDRILVVTFTRKAAEELRIRTGCTVKWTGTFHSLCYRMLREAKSVSKHYSILSAKDQQILIELMAAQFNLKSAAIWSILNRHFNSANQDDNLKKEHLELEELNRDTPNSSKIHSIYLSLCRKMRLIDFETILTDCLSMLTSSSNADFQFDHILVDEFQDTNRIQLKILEKLAGIDSKREGEKKQRLNRASIFVVGDDDQCIYSWRGADASLLTKFASCRNTEVHKLDENFRSGQSIVECSNEIIRNVRGVRMEKSIWTKNIRGPPVRFRAFADEHLEAEFVVNKIQEWQRAGKPLQQIAILYRLHRISETLVHNLEEAGIEYTCGAPSKDSSTGEIDYVMAYIKFMINSRDKLALKTIMEYSTPDYKITNTKDLLTAQAPKFLKRKVKSMKKIGENDVIDLRTKLHRILSVVFGESSDQDDDTSTVGSTGGIDSISDVRKAKKYNSLVWGAVLEAAKSEDRTRREKNSWANHHHQSDNGSSIIDFLLRWSGRSLDQEAAGSRAEKSVQLMTLHSAKGLEFRVVFIIGCEEGVIPWQRGTDLDEEVRLLYVGMSRARSNLFLTMSRSRRGKLQRASSLVKAEFQLS